MARAPRLPVEALEATLGHAFLDRTLLRRALTHVSVAPSGRREDSYQRLEFLGDRVLGLVVSEMLCEAFPKAPEGELSRRLAALVRKESCAAAAQAWGVGAHLYLGAGEKRSGGREKDAILSDVCESLIGAVFLDGGFEAARALVRRTFEAAMRAPPRSLRDPKTTLQEWAQARGLRPPLYQEVARSGPDHAPMFVISVAVDGFAPCEAAGASKRIAEQTAAQRFLDETATPPPTAPVRLDEGARL